MNRFLFIKFLQKKVLRAQWAPRDAAQRFVRPWRHFIFFDGRVDGGVVSVGNMAGVLFEDIFNVKDIDPEGKKFDRGESTSELTIRCVGATTCRGAARAIFIARTIAS